MAITARTIITNPAAAAVAAWTVFGLSVLSTEVEIATPQPQTSACDSALNAWDSPYRTLHQREEVQCLMRHGHLVEARARAIEYLDGSVRDESLVNSLGIINIQLQRYEEASVVLAKALRVTEPSNATMENNFVWATLWVGNLDVEGQRRMYRRALEREPELCEALHTGMMVEWRAARMSHSFEQVEAIREFSSLTDRYLACGPRAQVNEYDKTLEDLSVVTALVDIDRMLEVSYNLRTSRLAQGVVGRLESNEWDGWDACELAVPNALDAQDLCQRIVDDHSGLARMESQSPRKVIVHW